MRHKCDHKDWDNKKNIYRYITKRGYFARAVDGGSVG